MLQKNKTKNLKSFVKLAVVFYLSDCDYLVDFIYQQSTSTLKTAFCL